MTIPLPGIPSKGSVTFNAEYSYYQGDWVNVLVQCVSGSMVPYKEDVWLVYLDGRFHQAFSERSTAEGFGLMMFEDLEEARS